MNSGCVITKRDKIKEGEYKQLYKNNKDKEKIKNSYNEDKLVNKQSYIAVIDGVEYDTSNEEEKEELVKEWKKMKNKSFMKRKE